MPQSDSTKDVTSDPALHNNSSDELELVQKEILRLKALLSDLIVKKIEAFGLDNGQAVSNIGVNPAALADMSSRRPSSVTVEQLQNALVNLEDSQPDAAEVAARGDLGQPADVGYYADKSPDGSTRYYPFGLAGTLPSPETVTAAGPKVFGAAIRSQRKKARLTQDDVAVKMGVSRGLVSQWESGQSRVVANDLSRLALALGTSLVDLVNMTREIDPVSDSSAAESQDKSTRAEYQEHILVSAFRLMTDEQREMTIRVVNALRG